MDTESILKAIQNGEIKILKTKSPTYSRDYMRKYIKDYNIHCNICNKDLSVLYKSKHSNTQCHKENLERSTDKDNIYDLVKRRTKSL